MLKVLLVGLFASQKMKLVGVVLPRREDLRVLCEHAASGALRPVLDRQVTLARAAEAVRHVAEGHAQGTSVVTI
jgi:NADPH:quinone reductase-like Zn-dependent oxidoreductase